MLTRWERYRWHYSEQAPAGFLPSTRIPLPSYYTGDNIKFHISNLILVNYNITTTHYIIHIMVYMLNGMLNPCGDQYTAYNISGSIFLWCPPSLEFCLSIFIFFVTSDLSIFDLIFSSFHSIWLQEGWCTHRPYLQCKTFDYLWFILRYSYFI